MKKDKIKAIDEPDFFHLLFVTSGEFSVIFSIILRFRDKEYKKEEKKKKKRRKDDGKPFMLFDGENFYHKEG